MRLLLDTHALLWWWTDDPRLSSKARKAIVDERNEIFVSTASAWEIATKQRLGKLQGVPDAFTRYESLVAADGFVHLSISVTHALRAGSYGLEHRDPFDRMLAAQAEIEQLRLVSSDAAFAGFAVKCWW